MLLFMNIFQSVYYNQKISVKYLLKFGSDLENRVKVINTLTPQSHTNV